jgi:hypothetical protein
MVWTDEVAGGMEKSGGKGARFQRQTQQNYLKAEVVTKEGQVKKVKKTEREN